MRDVFKWPEFLDEFSIAAGRENFVSEVLIETAGGPLIVWERLGCGPLVYVSAGIHGDEPAGPLALLEMMKCGVFEEGIHWLICAALNPEGLARGTRENAGGIDLNRDYLRKESKEVRAHAEWLAGNPVPDVFISFHEDWETEGFYFYEINLGEDDPLRAEAMLAAVGEYFAPEAGPVVDGHEVRSDGWIYHSSDPDLPDAWPEAIYLAHRGCPLSFTFETPSKADLRKRVEAHIAVFRAVFDSR